MSRIRTFLAIELEPEVRERLIGLQEKLAQSIPDVKWVEPENLHLTLLFLGNVDERELPAVCRAAQDAVSELPAFALTIESASCFPNARRPRVLWAGIGSGVQEVVAVHDALETALLELGCYRREERQYTPHITLGRVKSEHPSDRLGQALQKYLAWKGGESRVDEVHVMSSQPSPHGPEYTVVGRARLG
jgi:RNA 2',3'-cyclic 3'-phosphodiesterase